MPSPFPGMDPYLEHPAIFPGLHDRLIAYLGETLQSKLPEPYYAEIGDRLWVEVSQRRIGPDVSVLHREPPPAKSGKSGVAMASSVRSQPVVITVPQDEVREPYLQIFSRIEGERLVTTIEILSLANKTAGGQGRDLYLRKQREILGSRTNLVEIDLLRAGEHTTAVPLERALERAGPFDYHVCIHRFDNFEDFFVHPIRMEDRLPEIAIPLLSEDPPVPIDLQAVFDRAYDAGPYHRRISYGNETPTPPLSPERRDWAARLVMAR